MMVKDEADVLGEVLQHLSHHVDQIYAIDNLSTDGTQEILTGRLVTWNTDPVVGYLQSNKMTALAMQALADGHEWVVPVDADELWHVCGEHSTPVKDYLSGLSPDVQIVQARLYNHVPTDLNSSRFSISRMPYRQRSAGALPKVACRARRDLVIGPGNHSADYQGRTLTVGGLCIRHFSWRSEAQYLRKIRNGVVAYRVTDLPKGIGEHWRMWDHAYENDPNENILDHSISLGGDLAVTDHYKRWFTFENPEDNDELVYDPAPVWH